MLTIDVISGHGRRWSPVVFGVFVLSLEDMRSRKDVAEDWLGDKDGILIFVFRTRLSLYSRTL